MKAPKYLFAVWAGVLIYASLSVVFGAMGFSAHRQLEKEKKNQEINIENLKLINRELEDVVNSLLYDEDTLAMYARELGYASERERFVSERERFVRVVGLGIAKKNRLSPGSVLLIAEPQYTPDRTLRIIALCAGITIFICMVIFDVLKFFRERFAASSGDTTSD